MGVMGESAAALSAFERFYGCLLGDALGASRAP